MGNLVKIDKNNVEDIYGLTSMQEGMLFHYSNDAFKNHYYEQFILTIEGKIQPEIFEEAWNHVVQSNDTLRTVFRWKKIEKPLQLILKTKLLTVKYEDLSELPFDKKNQESLRIKEKCRNEIDLTSNPFNVALLQLDKQKYEMVISYHHIILDGWSNGIIFKEFFNAYQRLDKGDTLLVQKKGRFKEYLKWQLNQDKLIQKTFWKKYFNRFKNKTIIMGDREMIEEYVGINNYTFEIPALLASELTEFCKSNKVTLASFFYLVWGLILQKYTNTDDVAFGATVSGRNNDIEEIENITGMFINTVPIRVKQDDPSLQALHLLKKLNRELDEIRRFESTPLVEINDYIDVSGIGGLFNSIVVIENYPIDLLGMLRDTPFQVKSYCAKEETNYDLTIGVAFSEKITVTCAFREDKFTSLFINGVFAHFNNLMKAILSFPDKSASELKVIEEAEQMLLLKGFNDNKNDSWKEKSILELFENQVNIFADQIAVEDAQQKISFMELDERSDALAAVLIEKGVRSDSVVGILLDRSVETIIGLLAILKAGGAYMPISTTYPEDRIHFMLKNSNVKILLSDRYLMDKMKIDIETIWMCDWEKIYETHKNALTKIYRSGTDLTYVIYTSGTTGDPKGVMIEDRNVINLILSLDLNIYAMYGPRQRLALIAPFFFDASIQQIFASLLLGHTLCISAEEVRSDGNALVKFYKEKQIDISDGTPVHVNMLIEAVSDRIDCIYVKHFIIGGDTLKNESVKAFFNLFNMNGVKMTNVYGPTECCVDATSCLLTKKGADENVTIGRPLNNVDIYILDKNLKLLPVNVAGDIYISGAGVGRGYINAPELTAERFINNPFVDNGNLMYKTGDIGIWLPSGNIKFQGRSDNQVKIFGYRIELDEIENVMLKHEAVENAVVLDRVDEDGIKFLCAYIVAKNDVESAPILSKQTLQTYLNKYLPQYMIPTQIVFLEKLPYTTNLKIDKKKLLDLKITKVGSLKADEPENETEELLLNIWKEVMKKEKISVNDNFFELGGHSLKASSLAAKIHKQFDLEIPMKEIFKNPTIRSISSYIKSNGRKEEHYSIKKVEECANNLLGGYHASSAQKRMFILWTYDQSSIVYNMFGGIKFIGQFDIEKLDRIFKQLINRHEILRTSFNIVDDELMQFVHDEIAFNISFYEVEEDELESVAEDFVKPFDLRQAPLFRVGIVKYGDNQHIMLVDMNHIISDGVSMNILSKEFIQLYLGQKLGELQIQYKDFSAWQNNFFKSDKFNDQKEYWLNEMTGKIPLLNLPTISERDENESYEGRQVKQVIRQNLTMKMRHMALNANVSIGMILMSAYYILLSKYASQDELIIGCGVAGRGHDDLENVIGMFVNLLPIRVRLNDKMTFEEVLNLVSEKSLLAYDNQDYQYEQLITDLNCQRVIGRNPLFDAVFTMLDDDNTSRFSSDDFEISRYEFSSNKVKFDMQLTAFLKESEIMIVLDYRTSLFKTENMEIMFEDYINIIRQVMEESRILISAISSNNELRSPVVMQEEGGDFEF